MFFEPRLCSRWTWRPNSLTGTRKRQSHRLKLELWASRVLFPRQAEGKGNYTFGPHVARLRWPFTPACPRKNLPRSPPSASEVASGFRGFEKLRNPSTSNCFPLDFGGPPKPEKPGARDGLGVHLQWVALWACSRWAVPPACRAKGYFEAPWGCSRSSFPLPVKEKAFPSLPQALPKCPRASEALEVPKLINIVLLSFGLWRTSEIGKSGLPKPDSPGARDGLRTRVRWTAFSECS